VKLEEVSERSAEMLDEVERAVVGKRSALELVLTGILADGHVLVEDLPGLAKTMMAASFARVAGLDMRRVQFTPDLMPADLTGSAIFDPRRSEFEFRRGPIFANLVLGDEINRAPPKTQAALLEAMQERQVSADGHTHRLPSPFLVIATQNPLELEGTYPLPEAQLDRFLVRVSVGYPDPDDERMILERRMERRHDTPDLRTIADGPTVLSMQAAVETVHVSTAVLDYIVAIVNDTRTDAGVQTGASPRGSLALLRTGQARAAIAGRDFVTPDDVKALAVAALGHRIVLRPERWVRGGTGNDVVAGSLERVPAPNAAGALLDQPTD